MNNDGLVIVAVALSAGLFGSGAKAAAAVPPTWGSRLFVSTGAAAAVAAACFMGVLWVGVRGRNDLSGLGLILLAMILAFAGSVGTLLACLVSSGSTSALRSIARWAVPLGYAVAIAVALFGLVHGF